MSKADRTREFIIEKTAQVFNKKGYAGTSLNDLTEATGLTKGALYGNFENKDDMAVAVFEYNLSLVRGLFFGKSDGPGNALEQLLGIPELLKANFRLLAAHGGCPILNTSTEADDNHPLLKKNVCKAIESWHNGLQKIIERGIKEKSIRKGIQAKHYANVIMAMVEGSLMLSKVSGDLSFLNAAMDQLKNLLLKELKP